MNRLRSFCDLLVVANDVPRERTQPIFFRRSSYIVVVCQFRNDEKHDDTMAETGQTASKFINGKEKEEIL